MFTQTVARLTFGVMTMAVLALAQNPHYVNGPSASLVNGDAVVAWKEAGLGGIVPAQVTYTASAQKCDLCLHQSRRKSSLGDQQAVSRRSGLFFGDVPD